jgi:Uri superfamily endonuclease
VKGSYVLVLELPEKQTIPVGSLGVIDFASGYYAYVGSALSSLESRINRHLRRKKKPHWHIDYLLQKASISAIVTCRINERIECNIARALSHRFKSVPGFGSSDCKCRSHLFYSTGEMEQEIMAAIDSMGVKPRLEKFSAGELSFCDTAHGLT